MEIPESRVVILHPKTICDSVLIRTTHGAILARKNQFAKQSTAHCLSQMFTLQEAIAVDINETSKDKVKWEQYCRNVIDYLILKLYLFDEQLNTVLNTVTKEGAISYCTHCANDANKKCRACGCIYCSDECQRKDWPFHRSECVKLVKPDTSKAAKSQ